jgi:heme-degrading monooxygenase HmoA
MKGRVVFQIRLKPGRAGRFLQTYEAIRHQVSREVRGHIIDQVCRSIDDPQNWLLTSEWECIEDFLEWERDPRHRHLVGPLRECWEEAVSKKYVVLLETGGAGQVVGSQGERAAP